MAKSKTPNDEVKSTVSVRLAAVHTRALSEIAIALYRAGMTGDELLSGNELQRVLIDYSREVFESDPNAFIKRLGKHLAV